MTKSAPFTVIAMWLISGIACTNSPASPPTTVAASESATPAENAGTSTSSNSMAQPEFLASGPIIVENEIDITAQRDGIVSKIIAEAGVAVKKGQLLATLDDRQISADLEAARAKTRSTE